MDITYKLLNRFALWFFFQNKADFVETFYSAPKRCISKLILTLNNTFYPGLTFLSSFYTSYFVNQVT